MAELFNDSPGFNATHSTRILTIPYNGAAAGQVTYVAEDFNPTAPSEVIERKNQANEPSDAVYVAGRKAGTATLQLSLATTALPALGAVFYGTNIGSVVPDRYLVTEVGAPESIGAFKTTTISFRKIYNL